MIFSGFFYFGVLTCSGCGSTATTTPTTSYASSASSRPSKKTTGTQTTLQIIWKGAVKIYDSVPSSLPNFCPVVIKNHCPLNNNPGIG